MPVRGEGRTILVVEDDNDVVEALYELLTDQGFRVIIARDLAAAFELFHLLKNGISWILLDGQLVVAQATGGKRTEVTVEFAQMVVNDCAFRGRVVPLSGNMDIQMALVAICGSGVPKPVDIDQLFKLLST